MSAKTNKVNTEIKPIHKRPLPKPVLSDIYNLQMHHKKVQCIQVNCHIQQMHLRSQVALIFGFFLLGCLAQDALISPQEPFTYTLNDSGPLSQQYLVEVNPQTQVGQWAALSTHFTSSNPDTIVEMEYSIVNKANPTFILHPLNKCRFEGDRSQWCKIGQRNPPLNIHHHLLKVNLQCPRGCQFTFTIAHAQTKWNPKDQPKLFSSSAPSSAGQTASSADSSATDTPRTSKTQALVKVGGWMLFTLFLVLGAIKFAVKVADWVDEKAEKSQQLKRKTRKSE